jgi:hypothetical protein
MDNNPVIYAMIAVFLALGEAMGESVLQRAGGRIRDLIADEVVSPETSDILETVLVGIDYDPTEPDPEQMPSPETALLFDQLATIH